MSDVLPTPRTVRHVDLADELPELGPDDDRGAFVVAWHDRVPLGALDLGPERLPLSSRQLADLVSDAVLPAVWGHLFARDAEVDGVVAAPDLAALARVTAPLHTLSSLTTLPPRTADDLSIVVCTRDRPEPLATCLTALTKLDPQPFEIVVVDNASRDDATRAVVLAHPDVRYVREPRPGLDVARNTGVRVSRGGIVAFTDDDVRVESNWAGRIGHAFENADIDALVGLVLPAVLDTPAQVIFEQYWSLGRGCVPAVYGPAFFAARRSHGVPVWEIGAGANMAFRRTALHRVGPFDERLDVGAAGCSGDSEMWYRILSAGGRIRYEPTAVVHHTHRTDIDQLRSQVFHYLRGLGASLLVQFGHDHEIGNLRHMIATLPAYYARLALRRARSGADARTVVLGEEVRGLLAGCRYYASTRRGDTA
ncbi:hypothetical protein BH23ACT10_BH23ACT10_35530 [soil metagenome]